MFKIAIRLEACPWRINYQKYNNVRKGLLKHHWDVKGGEWIMLKPGYVL